MKLLHIFRSAGFVTKHKWLSMSLFLFFSTVNSFAKEGITYSIIKDTTNENLSTFFQVSPVKGKVISPFGRRGRRMHTGTDIKLQKGDTVRATCHGIVKKAAPYFGYGKLIILKHLNKIETYYSHLSKCLVNEGDSVVCGQAIGLGGRTGSATTNHLHFEIRINNRPCNSEKYFDFSNNVVLCSIEQHQPIAKVNKEEVCKSDRTKEFIIIHKGDTLYAIARQYGTTVKQIQELNNLNSSLLKIGMKLKVK